MTQVWPDVARQLLDRLRPAGRCRLCGRSSSQPLCQDCCAQRLAASVTRCRRCATRLPDGGICGACLSHPPPFSLCLTLADYAAPLDGLLQAIKFGAEPALGRWFGRQLGQRWRALDLPQPQLVLPVPLSSARLVERGYNQSWEIARALAAEIAAPASTRLLRRSRDDPAQSSLQLARRAANVRGAFVASPRVSGLRLLLVDDVMTSASTAGEASRALLRAGATGVMVAVALRTPAPG